jgi:hypothetical protein
MTVDELIAAAREQRASAGHPQLMITDLLRQAIALVLQSADIEREPKGPPAMIAKLLALGVVAIEDQQRPH